MLTKLGTLVPSCTMDTLDEVLFCKVLVVVRCEKCEGEGGGRELKQNLREKILSKDMATIILQWTDGKAENNASKLFYEYVNVKEMSWSGNILLQTERAYYSFRHYQRECGLAAANGYIHSGALSI